MKERPILFSAPMVRALLDGTKSQTRRIAKTYPGCHIEIQNGTAVSVNTNFRGHVEALWCPYGKPGDLLWVRETWGAWPHLMGDFQRDSLRFRADGEYQNEHGAWRWRPSIHMPRWASRITLEVTAVRVERLQDISEADAKAEGAKVRDIIYPDEPRSSYSYVEQYRLLWESINGPGSWDANPWVWVVEFQRVQP